jgi:hypothetical protein
MLTRIIRQTDRLFIGAHFGAWLAVVGVWVFNWNIEHPTSGPTFNFAKRFISRVDLLVYSITQTGSLWIAVQVPTSETAFVIAFAFLILLTGTIQWFLIGRLVKWISAHLGFRTAVCSFVLFCFWMIFCLFTWFVATHP